MHSVSHSRLHALATSYQAPPRISPSATHTHFTYSGLKERLADKRAVDDLLGLGGEVERGEGVEVVAVLGRHVGDHDGVRGAAERVLQQARQLAVPVGHPAARRPVQRVHHLAEGEERQVDGAALLQADALIARAPVVLGTRQVHQVEFARLLPVGMHTAGSDHLGEGCLEEADLKTIYIIMLIIRATD